MAERAATVVVNDDKTVTVTWSGLLDNDTGVPVFLARYPDKTLQVTGDFSGSAVITMQGSNIATPSWGAVNDAQGVAIAPSTNECTVFGASPLQLRPSVTTGDGSTNLVCTLVCVARGA